MAKILLAYLVDVYAVISDLAVRDLVETVQNVCYRSLSGAGGTDKSDFLTGLCVKRYIKQYLFFFVV